MFTRFTSSTSTVHSRVCHRRNMSSTAHASADNGGASAHVASHPSTGAATASMLPHALHAATWHRIRDVLTRVKSGGGHVLVFLDYDGTLAPIVAHPERAFAPDHTLDNLRKLHEIKGVTLAIVTGRQVEKARAFVGLDDVIYAGSHGLDIRSTAHTAVNHDAGASFRPALEAARVFAESVAALDEFAGATVEDNRYAVSLHYRNLKRPEQADALIARAQKYLEEVDHGRQLILRPGKLVVEFRPALHWHKGEALRHMVQALHARPGHDAVLVMGDDLTDEDMFEAARQWDADSASAIPILVGQDDMPPASMEPGSKLPAEVVVPEKVPVARRTAASYAVRSPFETSMLLQRLAEALTGSS